jgi:predicted ATP-grasp superfamily ATP-dependent carboligase
VHRFLVAMAWSGVFELELLETPTERSLIDFNPRLYGSISLAIAAGANLPAIWCDHLLGRERPFVLARPGHRYRFEAAEANNLLAHLRAGRWREAARVARPKRGVTHAIFSLDDPAPFAADLRRRTRKARVAAPRSGATVGAGR